VPYLSASAVVIHYEEVLYQAYAPLQVQYLKNGVSYGQNYHRTLIGNIPNLSNGITFHGLEWSLARIARSRCFSTLNILETTRDREIVTIERQ